jgi:hypothetical protein
MRVALAALLVTTAGRAAVVTAPGYLVRTIPTPDVVQGGVVRRGGALLVGQGAFGPGGEYVVRLDGNGTTVVATGFNSLGGFDLTLDGALLVVDNGGELPGAVTGDTLFEIENALTRTSAVTAAGREVLPVGTIPAAQDVLVIPETVLVTDAAGPGAGRVVQVTEDGEAIDLITGLDLLGGLAFVTGGTVIAANVDGSFAGSLLRYNAYGHPAGTLVSGLSGAFAPVVDTDGSTVLVSGGVAEDGSGTIVAIAPDGTVSERARGFAFSTEMFLDVARAELLVLDVGARAVTAICADGDADGVCDADDPCTITRPVSRSRLTIGAGRRLRFSGRTPVEEAFDPAANGLRLVLEGGAGTVIDAAVSGGPGWRVTARGRRWTYRGRPGAASGIARITLRVRAGMLAFDVVARPGRRPSPADVPLRASLVLHPGEIRRACGVATPACVFRRGGSVLRCR